MKKISEFFIENCQFLEEKFSIYLNRRVFVTICPKVCFLTLRFISYKWWETWNKYTYAKERRFRSDCASALSGQRFLFSVNILYSIGFVSSKESIGKKIANENAQGRHGLLCEFLRKCNFPALQSKCFSRSLYLQKAKLKYFTCICYKKEQLSHTFDIEFLHVFHRLANMNTKTDESHIYIFSDKSYYCCDQILKIRV